MWRAILARHSMPQPAVEEGPEEVMNEAALPGPEDEPDPFGLGGSLAQDEPGWEPGATPLGGRDGLQSPSAPPTQCRPGDPAQSSP